MQESHYYTQMNYFCTEGKFNILTKCTSRSVTPQENQVNTQSGGIFKPQRQARGWGGMGWEGVGGVGWGGVGWGGMGWGGVGCTLASANPV